MLFDIELINIHTNEDGSISIHFFGDDKHRDIQLDLDSNEMIGSGCYVDSEAPTEARAEAEAIGMVSEKKCTFCHKTIPDGKEIYLDEGGSDGFHQNHLSYANSRLF
jgi:hypothetical protein